MKKHRLLQAVLVAFILIAAYGAYRYMVVTKPVAEKNKAKKSVVHVRADTVALRDYDVVYTCFAKVHAGATVRLSSEVNARIVAGPVALREGTSFRKGDLLVRLYDDDARASLMAARSRYMSLLSQQLSDLAVDFPQEADKWNAFFNRLSVDEDLPPLPAINSAKEKVYLAVRNVISEYYGVRQAEINLRKYAVYAPFDGVFSTVSKEVGAIASVGGEIATITQTDRLELEAGVEPDYVRYFSCGSAVTVEDERGGFRGTVARIAPFVDENTQRVKVYIRVETPGRNLISGQLYRVRIAAARLKEVVRLPREALFDDDTVYACIDGRLRARSVEVVYVDEDYAYLRGLEPGTLVVAESLVNPSDGMEIGLLKGRRASDKTK